MGYARHNGTAPQARTSAARADDRRGRRGAGWVTHRVTQEFASLCSLLLPPGFAARPRG